MEAFDFRDPRLIVFTSDGPSGFSILLLGRGLIEDVEGRMAALFYFTSKRHSIQTKTTGYKKTAFKAREEKFRLEYAALLAKPLACQLRWRTNPKDLKTAFHKSSSTYQTKVEGEVPYPAKAGHC